MVNGQHFSGTGYQLDGTDNRDPILGIIVINPNSRGDRRDEDHVAELRCRVRAGDGRRGVDADASRARNEFHGSVFEFYQDDAFQARNPFTQSTRNSLTGDSCRRRRRTSSADRSADRSSKDRVFFFGDYQGTRSNVGGSQLLTRPDRGGAHRRSERLRHQHLRSG